MGFYQQALVDMAALQIKVEDNNHQSIPHTAGQAVGMHLSSVPHSLTAKI
ncbi:hypothetical protein [Anabaena sp. CCY 0017]